MNTFDATGATLTEHHGIRVGRWSQYAAAEDFPFEAMWCVVPPSGTSAEDKHPEVELAVVVQGAGVFDVGDRRIEVPTGMAVMFESEERHVIHNHSEATPLVLLSIYWMPEDAPDPEAVLPRAN